MPAEWTSFQHPDPTQEQLKVVQRVLLRLAQGDVPNISPNWEDAVSLPSSAGIKSKDWKALLPNAYIWMECAQITVEPCSRV